MKNPSDLYGGSLLSKGLGLLSLLALLSAAIHALALEWGLALTSIIASIGMGYVSYRQAGGSRNPVVTRRMEVSDLMKVTGGVLDRQSALACTLLTQAAFEGGLIGGIRDTYARCCREALGGFGVEPRSFHEDDEKRLAFEVLCYAAFLIMSLSPKYLVRRSLWGTRPDHESIERFNIGFLQNLRRYLSAKGISDVREVALTAISPDIEFGLGDPVNLAARIAEYARAASSGQPAGFEAFGRYLGLALDPANYLAGKVVGVSWAEHMVDLANDILKTSLKDHQPA